MSSVAWIKLTNEEIDLLLRAMEVAAALDDRREIEDLSVKLRHIEEPYPQITVGVYGGQVQWGSRQPFSDPSLRLWR